MKTPKIIEGLTILQKYRDNPDGFHTGSEHDCIYAFATSTPLSPEDLSRMVKLGWFQDSESYGDDDEAGGNFSEKHYDPQESWCCYT